MVPHTIRQNLAALRRRERLLTFVWGLACWIAVVLALLLMGGFVDWFIDRERDTPMAVRIAVAIVQIVVAIVAGIWFLIWPQVRRLPDTKLALWVEDTLPHFEHRLISAVQFNLPGARVEGMSAELITLVTREAEIDAGKSEFAKVADHTRLKSSAMLLAPVLLLAGLPFLVWPQFSLALLRRQALLDEDIPHSVYLESATVEAWPIGDKIPVRYRVRGDVQENMTGRLSITPDRQPTDVYKLKFIEFRKDEKTAEHYALFGEDVHPSSVNILYAARLADGRTKRPSTIKLVPRPVIVENEAWVALPEYCGKRPDGARYEIVQGRGDVVGIPSSQVRVAIKIQKPIREAWIELLGPEQVEVKTSEDDAYVPEVVKSKIKMDIAADGLAAQTRFDLGAGLTGYRMSVVDEYGFDNAPKPRRSLRLVAEDPPQVMLLRDSFGPGADLDVEGMPVPLGDRIRIPYVCYGPYGLGKAQLLYRVLKKHESGQEPAEEEPWIKLPLPEDPDAGAFDPKTGVFANKTWSQAVPFHAAPSAKPDTDLGRTLGGGRVFLATKGLIDVKGMPIALKSGDQIEYCVDVFAAHREPAASTPFARSESRVSTVVRPDEFFTWLQQLGDEDKRLRVLKAKQEGVFETK